MVGQVDHWWELGFGLGWGELRVSGVAATVLGWEVPKPVDQGLESRRPSVPAVTR
jgi:hypothetical protein